MADYGWMPKDQGLFLSVGGDYFQSGDNFQTNGTHSPILYDGASSRYTAYHFWAEPEYTFTSNWSGRLRLGFISNSVSSNSGINFLSGSGISEILLGVKYRVTTSQPSLVIETTVKFPTTSNYVTAATADTALLPADGSVDVGLTFHGGYHHKALLLAVSPEFLVRSSGFAPAVFIRGGAGVSFPEGYFLATSDLYASLGTNLLFDSSLNIHDAAGTGGSYALLSGSPSVFTVGFKGGVRVVGNGFFEAFFRQAVWGVRAPYFYQIGINALITFDFHVADTRVKAHEIPFDSEPETNPDGM